MLTQISIRGFKCFDNVDISLKNLTLLTGVNSSGKSSIIQAILLLMQQKEKGLNPLNGKYARLGLIQDVKNCITNPKIIEIEVKAEEDANKKKCGIQLDLDGKASSEGLELLEKRDFAYLSAERIGAEDVYKQNLTDEYRIGIHGEFAFDYLSKERMNKLREDDFQYDQAGANLGNQVDYWLNYITGYTVTAQQITGTEVVKVSYRRGTGGSREVKPYHVGTGISYVANVIVAALSCKKDSLFIVENPEIHLHPGAQAKLLEFFCFLAVRGLQVIVETHSDHIFNGVRKSIKSNKIAEDKVSVYFLRQDANYLSEPVNIQIDKNGVIRNHVTGLFDQFDDDLDELLGL